MTLAENNQSLASYDSAPFFDRAFKYAVQHKLIDQLKIDEIINDAATGTVQIAEYFGASSHLRQNLEESSAWMVQLVSLYLEDTTNGDLGQAVNIIKEKSFRSLSRGGSQMLKALYSLSEDNHFGSPRFESESEFLKKCLSSHITVAKYRQTLKECEQFKFELSFASWLIKKLGAPISAFNDLHAPAEHVIRTSLIFLAYGAKKVGANKSGFPNENGLFEIFTSIRKEWAFLGDVTCSKKFLEDFPEDFMPMALQTLTSIQNEDVPKIVNPSVSLATIFADLKVRQYFFLFDALNDVSQFDKKLSEDWYSLTGGAEDDALLLTLFICAASGLAPKTSLMVCEAKKAVLNIRENGLLEKEVDKLIKKAPHDDAEQLSALWSDFVEDASVYFFDESDENLSQAIAYLTDHCNINKKLNG